MGKGDMLNPLNGIKAVGKSLIHPNQAMQGIGHGISGMFHHGQPQQGAPTPTPGQQPPQGGMQPQPMTSMNGGAMGPSTDMFQQMMQRAPGMMGGMGMNMRKPGFGGGGSGFGGGGSGGGLSVPGMPQGNQGNNPYRDPSTGFGRRGSL